MKLLLFYVFFFKLDKQKNKKSFKKGERAEKRERNDIEVKEGSTETERGNKERKMKG